jgi:3-deoxy-7-phosphoheptulonate synthase
MYLPSPRQLKEQFPLSDLAQSFVCKSRKKLVNIIEGVDRRLLFVVGPCSIHYAEEGLLFAKKLKELCQQIGDSCFIVMRAYIEKPRTLAGWKGLVHDPHLNGNDDLAQGLATSRSFLVDLAEMGIPVATEFLTPHLAPYIEDTISWGCIGARTSSSQVHRLLASSFEMPVGFKNSIDGNIDCAISGAAVASSSHTFMHFDDDGKLFSCTSKGNSHTHVVLRGSLTKPNYDKKTILDTLKKLKDQGLPERILIDCSHGNSNRHFYQQRKVFESVMIQIQGGNHHILGMMLESNLEEGKQSMPAQNSGVSITDGCLDYSTTAELISSVSSERSMSLTHS